VAAATLPKDITKVRAFLGLCNFFRGHVRNFAQLLTTNTCEGKGAPCRRMLRKPSKSTSLF
jgi:hypothetical protein